MSKASMLVMGDQVIWQNPEGLGHAFIGLRKQIREEQIMEFSSNRIRWSRYLRFHDEPVEDLDEPIAETMLEIRRTFRRHNVNRQ